MDGPPTPTGRNDHVERRRADERVDFEVGDDPPPAMFRAIAETSINPFAIVDDDGVFRWVGQSIDELLGWKPHDLVGKTIDMIIAPESLPDVLEAFHALDDLPPSDDYPRGGVGQAAELLHRDGGTVHCDLLAATCSQTGLPYHVVFARRAGYQRALDQALEAIAEHAEVDEVLVHLVDSLQQSIPGAVVVIGNGWEGDRFATATGDAVELLVPDPASPWAQAMETGDDVFVETHGGLPSRVAALAMAQGLSSCWVHPVVVPGDDAPTAALVIWRPFGGTPTRFTWTAVHRTGRILRLTLQWDRSRRALEFAATHDTLTGLANRPVFVARLAEIAKLAEGEAAVLFVDLDRFKPVNDQLGHLAGDRVLRMVADRLAGGLRPGDLVARIGGDEFAVLCERLAHPDDAEIVADRLLDALSAPILLDGHELTITASIGIAALSRTDESELILARADLAMREAKALGRARWVRSASPVS